MQKINQICQEVAEHPSKINQIIQALEIAVKQMHPQGFKPIIEVLRGIKNTHNGRQIQLFVQGKLKVILECLITVILKRKETMGLHLLEQIYEITNQKMAIIKTILSKIEQSRNDWSINWPTIILQQLCELIAQKIDQQQWNNNIFLVNLIIDLPHFQQLQTANQHLNASFKKSFQKLLLTTLSKDDISREQLMQLYRHLGDRVFSKLSQPLCLANHCIVRFANDPELQIQLLACLFILVGKYGLELEQFYPKLQILASKRQHGRSVYDLSNSKRFFKLLEAALRSSRVPFNTVSAFAKMLVAQLPGEESEFAYWALSFIVNLTKKHRKLLDQLPTMPEFKLLKYHYSSKVRSLVGELSKNLNKIDYLEIQQFGRVNCSHVSASKMATLKESLKDDEIQFKLPALYDPL